MPPHYGANRLNLINRRHVWPVGHIIEHLGAQTINFEDIILQTMYDMVWSAVSLIILRLSLTLVNFTHCFPQASAVPNMDNNHFNQYFIQYFLISYCRGTAVLTPTVNDSSARDRPSVRSAKVGLCFRYVF